MTRFLSIILVTALAFYLATCLGLFLGQRSFIYYPPPRAGGAAPVTSTLTAPGAVLQVSERPLPGNKAVIYFGGNAEDVAASLPLLARAYPDRALFLPHYRGYAGSTGTPSETALVADALLLLDRVAATHPDIVLVGRSLGSGVAVQVASRRQVGRLVLVTPFASLQEIAARHYPYMPVRWLLRDKYESWRYAPAIRAPVLIVAAADDEIIPPASTERLLSRFAPGVASMTVIADVGHNSISAADAYLPALQWASR